MNNEKGRYGGETLFAIKNQGLPYLLPHSKEAPTITGEFIDTMLAKEQEMTKFISAYYNIPLLPKFTNQHKLCKVRELLI